jgi:hypothetical protein
MIHEGESDFVVVFTGVSDGAQSEIVSFGVVQLDSKSNKSRELGHEQSFHVRKGQCNIVPTLNRYLVELRLMDPLLW